MSDILATSPALPGEAPTVEGRLADIFANSDVDVGGYTLSPQDRRRVVDALRATQKPASARKLFPPCVEPPYFAGEDADDDKFQPFLGWDHETGRPSIDLFANAIQVWAMLQNRLDVTLQEAAAAFNVPIEMVRQAVEHHHWMLVGRGDVIEHDGE